MLGKGRMIGPCDLGLLLIGLLSLFSAGVPAIGQQVSGQDIDKILERADKLLDEAKAGYEDASSKGAVSGFIETGFKLEEARIKYLVLQEIGSADKQKLAADRLRAVNQLSKLIHDGKVAFSGTPAEPNPAKPPDPAPAKNPPPVKGAVDVTKRAPVPDANKQQDAEKIIKDLFKEQYAKRSPDGRKALARALLDQALKPQDDPAVLWVLCREAQDAAILACDAEAITLSIETAAKAFDVDAFLLKNTALTAAGKTAKAPEESGPLAEALMQLVDDLILSDQYDLADKAVGLAGQLARKNLEPGLIARTTSRSKEVAEAKSLFQAMKSMLEVQARNPDDPAANLEIGRFLCFVKGSWDLGLRFILKGSDPALKALAEKELAAPGPVAERLALADGWYDLAEKDKSPLRKNQLQAHARGLYENALTEAIGVTRAKIEKRLADLARPEGASSSAPTKGLVGQWLFDEGKGPTAFDSSGKGNHGTLNGGLKWVPGVSGSALAFDGSTGFVTMGVAGLPASEAPKSITWSQRVAVNPDGVHLMIVFADIDRDMGLHPIFLDGKLAVSLWGGAKLVAMDPPPVNQWHQLAYTFDGKTNRFYLNGVLKDSSTMAPIPGAVKRFELGRWGGSRRGAPAVQYFAGILDEIRIYNRPLSDPEVQAIAKRRK